MTGPVHGIRVQICDTRGAPYPEDDADFPEGFMNLRVDREQPLSIKVTLDRDFEWRSVDCVRIVATVDGIEVQNYCIQAPEGEELTENRDDFLLYDRYAAAQGVEGIFLEGRMRFNRTNTMTDDSDRTKYTAAERNCLGRIQVEVIPCKHRLPHAKISRRQAATTGCTRTEGVKISADIIESFDGNYVAEFTYDMDDAESELPASVQDPDRCNCKPVGHTRPKAQFSWLYMGRAQWMNRHQDDDAPTRNSSSLVSEWQPNSPSRERTISSGLTAPERNSAETPRRHRSPHYSPDREDGNDNPKDTESLPDYESSPPQPIHSPTSAQGPSRGGTQYGRSRGTGCENGPPTPLPRPPYSPSLPKNLDGGGTQSGGRSRGVGRGNEDTDRNRMPPPSQPSNRERYQIPPNDADAQPGSGSRGAGRRNNDADNTYMPAQPRGHEGVGHYDFGQNVNQNPDEILWGQDFDFVPGARRSNVDLIPLSQAFDIINQLPGGYMRPSHLPPPVYGPPPPNEPRDVRPNLNQVQHVAPALFQVQHTLRRESRPPPGFTPPSNRTQGQAHQGPRPQPQPQPQPQPPTSAPPQDEGAAGGRSRGILEGWVPADSLDQLDVQEQAALLEEIHARRQENTAIISHINQGVDQLDRVHANNEANVNSRREYFALARARLRRKRRQDGENGDEDESEDDDDHDNRHRRGSDDKDDDDEDDDEDDAGQGRNRRGGDEDESKNSDNPEWASIGDDTRELQELENRVLDDFSDDELQAEFDAAMRELDGQNNGYQTDNEEATFHRLETIDEELNQRMQQEDQQEVDDNSTSESEPDEIRETSPTPNRRTNPREFGSSSNGHKRSRSRTVEDLEEDEGLDADSPETRRKRRKSNNDRLSVSQLSFNLDETGASQADQSFRSSTGGTRAYRSKPTGPGRRSGRHRRNGMRPAADLRSSLDVRSSGSQTQALKSGGRKRNGGGSKEG